VAEAVQEKGLPLPVTVITSGSGPGEMVSAGDVSYFMISDSIKKLRAAATAAG
jgi:hypothetical protein